MPITQKELASQNPWWENACNIEGDPKIVEFRESRIQWIPPIIGEITHSSPYSLFILRGPRQVGKTTAIKLTIQELLKTHQPTSVFFFDCEILYQPKELEETIEAYFEFLHLIHHEGISFIFLDEVTSLEGWSKVLKFLIDRGQFKKSLLVISGSNALDLKKGADRLPGRKGLGEEHAFLPLSFKEFLKVTATPFYQSIEQSLAPPLDPRIDALWERAQKLYPSLDSLNRHWESYLLCGGFPRLINEFYQTSSISYKTYHEYLDWIRGEIAKQKRDEKRGLQILAELSTILGSKLGWDTIAKKIGGVSHHTVEDYIQVSELLFIGKVLYQIDLSRKRIHWRKNKKFYFVDNLVYFLARGITEKWGDYFNRCLELLSSVDIKSHLVEQVVFNHLSRLQPDWLEPGVVFWSNTSEIDFILWRENYLLPIEVKWQRKVTGKDFAPMVHLSFKEGILLAQTTLERQKEFLILPTSLFVSLV